jgi:hypothetical protein
MKLAPLAVALAAGAATACSTPPQRAVESRDDAPCLAYYAEWDRVVGPVALRGDRARDCYWQLPQ